MKNFQHYIHSFAQKHRGFATNLGVTEERLKSIESGAEVPSYSELVDLSRLCRVPISYLIKEHTEEDALSILFRKQNALDATPVLETIKYFVNNVILLNAKKKGIVNLHGIVPQVPNSIENAEKLAFVFREEFYNRNHVDPILNLPSILSNELNFIVKVMELGGKTDGASAIVSDYVFILVSPRFDGRMLFTVAHELAHIINHHREGDYVEIDEPFNLRPTGDKRALENFANTFASALLLPKDGVLKVLQVVRRLLSLEHNKGISDVEILYVARIYGVSFDVAGSRMEQLGLLPVGSAASLSKKIKEDYTSPEKRADELEIPARQSILFPDLPDFIFARGVELIQEGDYSIGKLAEMLAIPVQSIVEFNARIVE